MTEPVRTDSGPATPPSDAAERAARIEELLVSGLDHYFAAEYEQAINIWTRVVFLERDHDRARAYIDRARTAIAERQRESEELLHRGVVAYNAGDVENARDLLKRAVDQGAPSDEALVLLERLERLEGSGFDASPPRKYIPKRRTATAAVSPAARHRWIWFLAATVTVALIATVVFGAAPALSWLADVPTASTVTQAPTEPLPVVRTADTLLDRARALYADGHLYDALRLLDRIGIADPVRPEADRLRADIQRDLLAATAPARTAGAGVRQ
jgi:tetratricopeptide (TPR) repeat protein